MLALPENLKYDPSSGGFNLTAGEHSSEGGFGIPRLEASKDCLSSPSPSSQRKQGGGSRGEEFGLWGLRLVDQGAVCSSLLRRGSSFPPMWLGDAIGGQLCKILRRTWRSVRISLRSSCFPMTEDQRLMARAMLQGQQWSNFYERFETCRKKRPAQRPNVVKPPSGMKFNHEIATDCFEIKDSYGNRDAVLSVVLRCHFVSWSLLGCWRRGSKQQPLRC